MTVDDGAAIGARLADRIEINTLTWVIAMLEDGVPPAQVAQALAWQRERIADWVDHELPGQVRAWIRTSGDHPDPASW